MLQRGEEAISEKGLIRSTTPKKPKRTATIRCAPTLSPRINGAMIVMNIAIVCDSTVATESGR